MALNPPASEPNIRKLEAHVQGELSDSLRATFRAFDGFQEGHYHFPSFIRHWSIDDILDESDPTRLPYLCFADRAYFAEMFEVCATDESRPIIDDGRIVYQGYLEFWQYLLSSR